MKNKFSSALGRAKKFWKNADAQDLVEYALLLMMIALIAVASVKSLSGTIKNVFINANVSMTELALPGNATGTVAASLAGNTTVDNAAANANTVAAAADGNAAAQDAAAAAADLAAAAAAFGVADRTTAVSNAARQASNANNTAGQAAFAAYNTSNVSAADLAVAQADELAAAGLDAGAGFAASIGINNGILGSSSLTAAANADTSAAAQATADAAAGVAVTNGTFLGIL